MLRFHFLCITILFCLNVVTYGQFSHQFTNTARNSHYGEALDVAVGPDGTIFLASGSQGLRAYTYDRMTFTNTAHIDDVGILRDVAVGPDGTLFSANGTDGMRAFTYDGSFFVNTAHINTGGEANEVAVNSDGIIFLANSSKGMFVYIYTTSTGIDDPITAIPNGYSLSQNYPNPFNPSTTICYTTDKPARVNLIVYDLLGREIETLVDTRQDPGTYTVHFDASDLVSGIYCYRLLINSKMVESNKMVLLK